MRAARSVCCCAFARENRRFYRYLLSWPPPTPSAARRMAGDARARTSYTARSRARQTRVDRSNIVSHRIAPRGARSTARKIDIHGDGRGDLRPRRTRGYDANARSLTPDARDGTPAAWPPTSIRRWHDMRFMRIMGHGHHRLGAGRSCCWRPAEIAAAASACAASVRFPRTSSPSVGWRASILPSDAACSGSSSSMRSPSDAAREGIEGSAVPPQPLPEAELLQPATRALPPTPPEDRRAAGGRKASSAALCRERARERWRATAATATRWASRNAGSS